MSGPDRERLRVTFDETAELYDRVRPGYPPELFDDLADLAGLWPGCRVLEIGCGTGQATVPLAERGCRIVAVELGAGMAAVARRRLARFPAVEVVVSAFEDWPLPAEPFDMVFAATAFHWVDPAVRVTKAADALRPGGASAPGDAPRPGDASTPGGAPRPGGVLATVGTHHVAGGDEEFFVEVQACYERWDPETPPRLRLPAAADVPRDAEEIDRSGRFGPTVFRRYEWEQSYTAAEYLDLLSTYSGHRALAPAARAGLFACIAALIDDRFGGRITKRYMTELRLARRCR